MHLDGSGKRICDKGSCPAMDSMKTGEMKEFPAYLHHKEGHRVSVSIKISSIMGGENGTAAGAVVVFSDNTKLDRSIREIEKLEDQAFSDPLTGVRNRRYADIYISMKLKEMKFFELPPLGALFIDIDHFKIFNDNYGHFMGDKVLVMVAKTLKNIIRDDDMVCRWGGEEFLVAIHGCSFASLRNMADRIRFIAVAVSVGGVLAGPEDTAETLIHRADEMMYKSKQAGRNRVTVEGITFPSYDET